MPDDRHVDVRGEADEANEPQGPFGTPSVASVVETEVRGPDMTRGLTVAAVAVLLIGWIPFVGPLVAGLAGGWAARTRIRGMWATLFPAALAMFWTFLMYYVLEVPFLTAVGAFTAPFGVVMSGASLTAWALMIISPFPLVVLGGWLGGWWYERRAHEENEGWPRAV